MNRRGQALVTLVLLTAAVIGIAVAAGHWLRGASGRTMFALQESRALVNLGRSALAEAHQELHSELMRRRPRWVDWCLTRGAAAQRLIEVPAAQKVAHEMGTPDYLTYRVTQVEVRRVRTLDEGKGVGEVELAVKLYVQRAAPAHHVELQLVERRGFWRAMPYTLDGARAGGRLVELSSSPLATLIEGLP